MPDNLFVDGDHSLRTDGCHVFCRVTLVWMELRENLVLQEPR